MRYELLSYSKHVQLICSVKGFIGKVLIEKLLRSCNKINRIFILVRGKRGKSALDRVKEFEDCVVGLKGKFLKKKIVKHFFLTVV